MILCHQQIDKTTSNEPFGLKKRLLTLVICYAHTCYLVIVHWWVMRGGKMRNEGSSISIVSQLSMHNYFKTRIALIIVHGVYIKNSFSECCRVWKRPAKSGSSYTSAIHSLGNSFDSSNRCSQTALQDQQIKPLH